MERGTHMCRRRGFVFSRASSRVAFLTPACAEAVLRTTFQSLIAFSPRPEFLRVCCSPRVTSLHDLQTGRRTSCNLRTERGLCTWSGRKIFVLNSKPVNLHNLRSASRYLAESNAGSREKRALKKHNQP